MCEEMTSALEVLAADVVHNVTRAVENESEGWAERAIERAEHAARRRLDGEEEALALAGLAAVKPVAPAIARAGVGKMKLVLSHLFAEEEASAKLAWLATDASFDERRKAMRDVTIWAVKEADQAELDWDAFVEAIKAAGEAAFKIAAPFLLAAIGL